MATQWGSQIKVLVTLSAVSELIADYIILLKNRA